MSKTHKLDAWTVFTVDDFNIYKLSLDRDEFVVTVNTVPIQCRFPAPNEGLGANTYRGNSFVKGSFQITSNASTPFTRLRGEEMTTVRWVREGGAEILGLEDGSEFWCVMSRDPSKAIYLQQNYALEAGQSVTIPDRAMARNLFVLEGSVTVDNTSILDSFSHATLGQAKEYVITNHTNQPAFVLYFYEADRLEFIAAADPAVAQTRYEDIPILSPAYWS